MSKKYLDWEMNENWRWYDPMKDPFVYWHPVTFKK